MSNHQQYPNHPPFDGGQPYPPAPPKKRSTRRTLLIAGLSFLSLLMAITVLSLAVGLLDGTDATKETSGEPAAVSSSAPTAGDSPYDTTPPAVEETTAPPEPEPSIAKVGAKQWFTYEDKLQVQVTKMTRFKISAYAAGGKPGDVGVAVTVTIKNSTGSTFDASLAQVNLAVGPNGDEAESVYDSEQNLSGGFTGSIPAGRSKTAKFGFAVPKGQQSKLIAEVTPSYDYVGTFFEGSVK